MYLGAFHPKNSGCNSSPSHAAALSDHAAVKKHEMTFPDHNLITVYNH